MGYHIPEGVAHPDLALEVFAKFLCLDGVVALALILRKSQPSRKGNHDPDKQPPYHSSLRLVASSLVDKLTHTVPVVK